MNFKKLIFDKEEEQKKVIRLLGLKPMKDKTGSPIPLLMQERRQGATFTMKENGNLLYDKEAYISYNKKSGQYHIKGLYLKTITPLGLLRCRDLRVEKANYPIRFCGKDVEDCFTLRTLYGNAIIPKKYFKGEIE